MTKEEIRLDIVDYIKTNLNNVPDCAEYDKMILCLPYNCIDLELDLLKSVAHDRAIGYTDIRLKDYNNDLKKHREARHNYLKGILGKIDKSSFIEPPFYVDYGCNIEIGKHFYSNFNVKFFDCTLMKFGDNVLVGPNVTFATVTHPTNSTERIRLQDECPVRVFARPIIVGNNVWFGSNASVLPGVTIGDGAVIGASAVVNSDIPENALVLGIPGKVVRIMKPGENKKVIKGLS